MIREGGMMKEIKGEGERLAGVENVSSLRGTNGSG